MDKVMMVLVIGFVVLVSGCVDEQRDSFGFISGKVTGANGTARVQAIQNLSLVAETITNPDGSYQLELPEGRYGLLFTVEGIVYIYNDEINRDWQQTNVSETIIIRPDENSPNHNIHLDKESADYVADQISVRFKSDVSEAEIERLVKSYNSTVLSTIKITNNTSVYSLDIPDDKTVLEMVRTFQSDPHAEHAEHWSILEYFNPE